MSRHTCVLNRRKRYAPNAITDVRSLSVGDIVFVVDLGHIYECVIREINTPLDNPESRMEFWGKKLGTIDLTYSSLGILPHPKRGNERPQYQKSTMVFNDVHDAIRAITHSEYPFKRPTNELRRDLEDITHAFSGYRDVPLRLNPNISEV